MPISSSSMEQNHVAKLTLVMPSLGHPANIFSSIANIDTLEETEQVREQQTLELSYKKSSSSLKEDQFSKIMDLSVSNESLNKKILGMSEDINDIIKSLCVTCGYSHLHVNNELSQNLCSQCNAIFCSECIKALSCFKCHKRVCEEHCIKCALCNRRACKEKSCIFEFKICQSCESTYCQEHFDAHKKYNQAETYKVSCTSKTCKINFDLGAKGIEDFIAFLIHLRKLNELHLRN